ncbi:MATE family efflux transporter [Pseudodesulfovibrio senegalensis]|uniref:MATE family efflux transporter n=1 Tax=Pseudodesulfovibrio senegalensis TaxID=1721087 RepID=A0A6N6N1F7_9BACT|nr:MATE family efflux transporter [Pseudodesulfovibrio senegalensis]KAB1441199.1 MATE family efflux transporter [Pseudodesulfovibrio senegalensis]
MSASSGSEHAFVHAPNKTLLQLAVPVLFSLVAEPVTGLVDTAFVARLGMEPVAALGIGAMVFSSIFWIFNFLGIGTQTEVARFSGENRADRAAGISTLAVFLGGGIGFVLLVGALPFLTPAASLLGGNDAVLDLSEQYMRYRLLGAPAVLVCLACFGSLRGCQDMSTPLWVATGMNLLNVGLDYVFVFGFGPVPALGVGGAGLASSLSQWTGAIWVLWVVRRRIGFSLHIGLADLKKLIRIGGDLFIRTGAVLLFLSLCTRVANQAGAGQGAAYQAGRQFFIFTALFMDAFAITAQSLVGFFLGRNDVQQARRVAVYACVWSLVTGAGLCLFMLVGRNAIATLLLPVEAHALFQPSWTLLACIMPLFSLACATDGIHWGAGDFRYLRNAMLVASVVGGALVLTVRDMPDVLMLVWASTGVWAACRGALGVVRISPGVGRAPLQGKAPIL